MVKDIAGRDYKAFNKPASLKSHGGGRIIAMCSQKGGVGKTTSTISLAAALAQFGRKVLVVDFDPQGAASVGLGVNAFELDETIYDLMIDPEVNPKNVVVKTQTTNVDLLPATIDLSAAEVQLVNEVARESILRNVLKPLVDDYDCILIDCQPSLGILTINALTAADGVLIPMATEYFAMRGVALLIDNIEKVQKRLNKSLKIDGIFATMFDSRTLHSQEVVESIMNRFHDDFLHTAISRTVKFSDSSAAAETIVTFAPTHSGAVQYRDLAKELISRGAIN